MDKKRNSIIKLFKDIGFSIYIQANLKTQKQNIIWFNPPFSKSVSTNIAKTFIQLMAKHFPRSHNLHKIFNRNTVKISYNCMNNMPEVIKGHNKKVTSKPHDQWAKCNCRKRSRMSNRRQLSSERHSLKMLRNKTIPEKSLSWTCRGRMKEPFL